MDCPVHNPPPGPQVRPGTRSRETGGGGTSNPHVHCTTFPRYPKGHAMPVSEAQKRATAKYRKEKMKQVVINFSPNEMELYDYIKAQPNMSGFLKSLVRDAMERS